MSDPHPHAAPDPATSARTTAVRALVDHDDTGVTLLRDVGSRYRDGGEQAVLATIRGASDIAAISDELIGHAQGWAQRYHLDPTRANIVRALDLPAHARVLEVGAGCGAITRYLGETCAVVDALEPVPARAAAAAERTRDQSNVEVFVGELDDLPAAPSYDVVIVIGVLEYVGAGTDDRDPYRRFLGQIADRLVDGGTLALAIENKLGVKYLAGAPEDHTNRVFDSIEGYPVGGNAHTFARRELESLMADAGLSPRTLGAFPDYKMTRMVVDDFPGPARPLFYRIPRFPSPDWVKKRPRLADEYQLWRSLVEGGLAREFVNSFLVLAHRGERATAELWPAGRHAVFYSERRRAALSTETVVEQGTAGVRLRRQLLAPQRAASDDAASVVRIDAGMTPFHPGRDVTEIVAREGVAGAAPYLAQWLELLDAAMVGRENPGTTFDLAPHNLLLGNDGDLHIIDEEFVVPDATRDQIVRRGIYVLAKECVRLAPPERWRPHTTVGEVMVALGEHVGLDADGAWLEQYLREETAVQVRVRLGRPADSSDDEWRAQITRMLRTTIDARIADLPHGTRLPERHARLVKDRDADTAKLARLRVERGRTAAELQREVLRRGMGRVARRIRRLIPPQVRRIVVRFFPPGTARGTLARRWRRGARSRLATDTTHSR